METVLYVTAEVLRRVGLMIQPYVPASSAKLLDLLAVPAAARRFTDFDSALVAGTALPAPSPVFPRYVDPEAEAAKS